VVNKEEIMKKEEAIQKAIDYMESDEAPHWECHYNSREEMLDGLNKKDHIYWAVLALKGVSKEEAIAKWDKEVGENL
jgi:hypothetical protein